MAQAPNQRNTDFDGIIMIAFSVGAIVLFAVVLWMRFHVSISTAHIFFRNILNWPIYQVYVFLVKLTGGDIALLRTLLSNTIELCAPTSSVNIFTTCTTDASQITFKKLSNASLMWNVIFGGLAIGLAFKGFLRISENHPKVKFGKSHSLDSFMHDQKQNYPHLRLFAEFNLQLVSSTEGALMGMKTSREFAKENNLVIGESYRELKYISNGLTKSQKDSMEKVPRIDRDKLILILRKQLGSLWVGVDNITNAEAIILARYLPTACSTDPDMLDEDFYRIQSEALKIEAEYWRIATEDVLNSPKFAPIGKFADGSPKYPEGPKDLSVFNIDVLKDKYIRPYLNHPVAKRLLNRHAYTRTFIIAVVFEARRLGVAAPCQLRWLKFYDREMWAFMTNIGRPSFFCENMGAVSHYQAEAVAKQMIYQPHFDVAIRGFEHQLQTYFYSEEALQIIKNKSDEDLLEDTIFDKMPDSPSPSNQY